jgi:hypothetical protein
MIRFCHKFFLFYRFLNADKRRYTQMGSVPDAAAIRYRPLAKVDISSITSALESVYLFTLREGCAYICGKKSEIPDCQRFIDKIAIN